MTGQLATVRRHSMSTKTKRRNRQLLAQRDGNHCHWCHQPFGGDETPTIDHVTPRSKGGRDALWNLVLACAPCNWARADTGEAP